jgi:hypothetical protein
LRSGYLALAVVFSDGQSRVKVAEGEVSDVKNRVSNSIRAESHWRVTGKKAVIPNFPQNFITKTACDCDQDG